MQKRFQMLDVLAIFKRFWSVKNYIQSVWPDNQPCKKEKSILLDLFKKEKFITEKYVQQRVLLIFFL